jgi:hypothetical protein
MGNLKPVKYNPKIVIAYFKERGLPEPHLELRFHETRKWRFDFGFLVPARVALEVNGGLFVNGGHNRGAQMLKDYEKYNCAASMGWRILFVTPQQLCTAETVDLIWRTLIQ